MAGRDRREMIFSICRETAANENHKPAKWTGFAQRLGFFLRASLGVPPFGRVPGFPDRRLPAIASRSGEAGGSPDQQKETSLRVPRVSNERNEWVVPKSKQRTLLILKEI